MAQPTGRTFSIDPALWIFTSLTAGSSHIVTATSRLETILRANRVPFKAVDIATDEKARMVWGRRAGKDANGRMRKLPGLVQQGLVLGDLVEIEEWNEYGELKEKVKIYFDEFTIPTKAEAEKLPTMRSMSRPVPVKTETPESAKKPDTPVAAALATAAAVAAKRAEMKEKELKKAAEPKKEVEPPKKSLADEAADRAKALRLQSLRKQVEADNKKKEEEEEDEKKKTEEEEAKKKAEEEEAKKKAEEEEAKKKAEEDEKKKAEAEAEEAKKKAEEAEKSTIQAVLVHPPPEEGAEPTVATEASPVKPSHDHDESGSDAGPPHDDDYASDRSAEREVKEMAPEEYNRLREALQEPAQWAKRETNDTRSIAETMDMDLSSDEDGPRSLSESLARLSRSASQMSLRERVRADKERENMEMEQEWQKLVGKAKELSGTLGEAGVGASVGGSASVSRAKSPAASMTSLKSPSKDKLTVENLAAKNKKVEEKKAEEKKAPESS